LVTLPETRSEQELGFASANRTNHPSLSLSRSLSRSLSCSLSCSCSCSLGAAIEPHNPLIPPAPLATTPTPVVPFGLRLIAYVLAFESLVALLQAWGELTRPIPGVLLVLLAGDPPIFVGCALVVRGATAPFIPLRRAFLLALLVFGAAFTLLSGDILASRIEALSALRPLYAQSWPAHVLNLCEVIGCSALVLAGGDVFVRARRPRPASFFLAAACILARAVTGLFASVWPRPMTHALVAVTGGATFASAAWLLIQTARAWTAPPDRAS
jgi:hypothetical protein